MSSALARLDGVLFGVLPYIAIFTFLLVTIQRYRGQAFTYSSLSSQFLENRQHFYGLVPFHYGILFVLAGHVAAFAAPDALLAWSSRPLRLYLLEVTGLAFGILTFVGLVLMAVRRRTTPLLQRVTSRVDWFILALLAVLVGTGISTAVTYRWGSSWFASVLTPYLWSLLRLSPELVGVSALPAAIKFHIVTAYLLILFFPFTRLVHVLVVPNPYLWRRPQVVRWYRRPANHVR